MTSTKKRKSKRKQTLQLTERDSEILKFIAEYGLTWFDCLHQRWYPNKHRDAVKSTLRRLMGERKGTQKRKNQRQLIYSAPLDGQRVYYQLTLSGTRLLGVSPKRAAAFGRTSIIRRYALQWFLCLEGSCDRVYIGPKEINKAFPSVAARLPQPNFYKAKDDDRQVLGYAVVDYGSDARRVATRLATKLNLFEERESFNGLIAQQAFEATVLTYRESKKHGIASRLSKHLITEGGAQYFKTAGNRLVPVKTLVVDRMEQLLLDPRKS